MRWTYFDEAQDPFLSVRSGLKFRIRDPKYGTLAVLWFAFLSFAAGSDAS